MNDIENWNLLATPLDNTDPEILSIFGDELLKVMGYMPLKDVLNRAFKAKSDSEKNDFIRDISPSPQKHSSTKAQTAHSAANTAVAVANSFYPGKNTVQARPVYGTTESNFFHASDNVNASPISMSGNLWSKILLSRSSTQTTSDAVGGTSDNTLLLIGVQFDVDEDGSLGVYIGQSTSKSDRDDNSSTKNTGKGQIYGVQGHKDFAVNYQNQNYDLRVFTNLQQSVTSVNGKRGFFGAGNSGATDLTWKTKFTHTRLSTTTSVDFPIRYEYGDVTQSASPRVGLSYENLKMDGYTESGYAFSSEVSSIDRSELHVQLGGEFRSSNRYSMSNISSVEQQYIFDAEVDYLLANSGDDSAQYSFNGSDRVLHQSLDDDVLRYNLKAGVDFIKPTWTAALRLLYGVHGNTRQTGIMLDIHIPFQYVEEQPQPSEESEETISLTF